MLAEMDQKETLQMVASATTIELIKAATVTDEQYQLQRRQISVGWPDSAADVPEVIKEFTTFAEDLVVCDRYVFKGRRVVAPREAKAEMLNRIHSSHIEDNGCIRWAQESVFYPGLTLDIKNMVVTCAVCAAHQMSAQKSYATPSRPWEKVGVDIFTLRNVDYLITADYLSGNFETARLPSKRVSDVIHCLRAQFVRHRLTMEVCSDNSPFNSADF